MSAFLDPVLQFALAAAIPPSRLEMYERDLQCMDWEFEFSDDGRMWRRGRDELARLKAERDEIDPSGDVWNRYAPARYSVPLPVGEATECPDGLVGVDAGTYYVEEA